MTTVFWINLLFGKGWPIVLWVIFLLLVAIYFFVHSESRKIMMFRYVAGGIITLFSIRALILMSATYSLWSTTLPGKYLLPPYQPISYFLRYSMIHFFAYLLLTFMVGLVVSIVLLFLKFRRPQILLPGDLALLFIGILLVQWPFVLLYIGALFMGCILLLLFQRYIIKGKEEIIFGLHILFWIPLFLLFGNTLIVFLGLQVLVMPL